MTPEEQAIIEHGKATGKTKEQALAALALYRRDIQKQAEKPKASILSRVITDIPEDVGRGVIGQGIEQFGKAGENILSTANDKDLNLAEKAVGIGAEAFRRGGRFIGSTIGTALKLPFTQNFEDRVGEQATEIGQDIAETELAQDLIQTYQTLDPETKRNVDNILGFTEGLVEIGTAGLLSRVTKPVLNQALNMAKKGVQRADDLVKQARPATINLLNQSKNIIKPTPTPSKAIGEVLQAKKPITAKEVEAFRNIDTTNVKTFAELQTKINNSIGNLSRTVDEALAQDPTPIPLEQLVTKTTSTGGRVIERNFVETALEHLSELYGKTADDTALANLEDLITKARTTGLTRLEVNDLSRIYNQEFGSKAFSKVSGDPLTSVNAQAYENVRSGLKDVARQGIGGAEAKAADEIISSLYNVRTLVEKNAIAVQRLQQRIAERGLLEKVGHGLTKYGDILTGGTLRGAVGGLLPRGAGYKTLNALDLEERLARNLEVIQKALESGSDDFIINATKQLEDITSVPKPE